jgi:hypothetical protein
MSDLLPILKAARVADAGPGANHEKRQTKQQFASEV